jgi:signal transduction histidine kinase
LLAIKDQIQQVILNLLLNSVEAMPGGGEIFIEASGNKDNVEVIIEDTGSGISDAERSRIFEPFVSTKPNGTGLGLAVSYGIVQAHGGSLELLTNHGRGARFRIVLPTGGGL